MYAICKTSHKVIFFHSLMIVFCKVFFGKKEMFFGVFWVLSRRNSPSLLWPLNFGLRHRLLSNKQIKSPHRTLQFAPHLTNRREKIHKTLSHIGADHLQKLWVQGNGFGLSRSPVVKGGLQRVVSGSFRDFRCRKRK